MTFLQRLNPKLHIGAAIGWAVFGIVTLAALMAANLAAAEADKRARVDAQGLLVEFATQVRDALAMAIESRRSVLQAAAAQIAASGDRSPASAQRALEAVRRQFPELVWMALVDEKGVVAADTADALTGDSVSSAPWFAQGRLRPFVSDDHAQLPAGKQVPLPPGARPPRLMDLAVPFISTPDHEPGVVAAFVSWSWVEQALSRMQDALNKRRQVEVMLTGRDGSVLVGPADWVGRKLAASSDITEGGTYVVGTRTQLRLAGGLGLGWTAVVRQSADLALAPVRTTRRTVFAIVFLAGLLSAFAAAAATRALTRRLSLLAADAEAVRRGEHRTLTPASGVDEVGRIGATLSQVVDHLQAEKQALETLNAELDSRVAERTRRIERMADEARHAAVTRERLRIARDLHDTLAHSLMALLTQIRLVRKLRTQMDSDELDAELGRAEAVAATGLSGARTAIMQMRDNGVRDTGLGPALQDLARRLNQRTGIAVDVDADPEPASWADDRAETVFRIVEEALRNVERHAQSSSVHISLLSTGSVAAGPAGAPPGGRSGFVVGVVDDGLGFDPSLPRPGHYGLLGMQEQAALIGARLRVLSEPGGGTRVVLEIDG